MAYVPVPKDLTKVKTKVALNLTKRQLIFFSLAAVVGVPFYLLTRGVLGSSISAILMVTIMLPFFFMAMYEKDGLPFEKVMGNIIRQKFICPAVRPYQTENFYRTVATLAKKEDGVKTGMALWQAKQVCPEIIFVPPRMDLYLRFSSMAREIYSEYTDKIEPYGIDEAWLDVTESKSIKGDGMKIAQEISDRIKYELGITVSIGISWNKIFAKLGSDYKKPDAITYFHRRNYKEIIWGLPVSDLLYVGRQTNKKLMKLGIYTIGQLAQADEKLLGSHFGKIGLVLWAFANGYDSDPVCTEGYEAPVKSIGNSTTTPRDLETDLDVWIILMALSESVSARLRRHGFKCNVVEISIRDNGLNSIIRQMRINQPTNITDEIVKTSFELFKKHYRWEHPIRSLGVRGADLVMENVPVQLDLFNNQEKREKLERLDRAVDEVL